MRKLSDQGVSEAIGFIIMFSLIVTGIGIVTLYGYPMLTEQRASSDEKAMERTMISVQNDMKLLTYSNIPYKDSAINVAGGALTVHSSTTSTAPEFRISYWTNATTNPTLIFIPGDLQYTSDAGLGVITLQNGAVVKRQEQSSGSYMVAEPRWFFDDPTNTLVIFLTQINAEQLMATGGIAELRMSRLESPTVIDVPITQIVRIVYTDDSENQLVTAWEHYIEDTFSPYGLTGSNPYSINVDRIVIKQYNITVENL